MSDEKFLEWAKLQIGREDIEEIEKCEHKDIDYHCLPFFCNDCEFNENEMKEWDNFKLAWTACKQAYAIKENEIADMGANFLESLSDYIRDDVQFLLRKKLLLWNVKDVKIIDKNFGNYRIEIECKKGK